MEASEITRRNVAIARYMGWRNDEDGWYLFDMDEMRCIVGENYLEAVPAFDSNWSLLMPAVEKIAAETDGSVTIWTHGPWWVAQVRDDTPDILSETMIGAVWMIVSDYCLSLEKPASDGKEA